jgi:hypothetical protein
MPGGSIDRDKGGRKSLIIARAGLCLAIIACGLALRGLGFGLGLPAFVVKYGGSALWGAMVFFLVAMAASHLTRPRIALIAAGIAISVELFRLVHFPWLDAFRLTLPGALLLGRIFSVWNMAAYGVGIAIGMLLDRSVPSMVRGSLAGAARHHLLRFPLRVFFVAFLTALFPAFFAAFLAVVLEAFLTVFLTVFLPAGFVVVFLLDFAAAFFAVLLFAFLAIRFGAARFLLRADVMATGGTIRGSGANPSAASGM